MPSEVFSGRSKEYEQFRLDYPEALKPYLVRTMRPHSGMKVADMGSGTGLLTRWFLEFGCDVYGVEPNEEMRRIAERALATYPNFKSVAGSAEASNLETKSIDLIAAGNAFHWFDQESTKREWKRILKPEGHVLLIRIDWKKFPHARMKAYDQILMRYCKGRIGMVSDPALEIKAINNFFSEYRAEIIAQTEYPYTCEQLIGRFLSTSFAPKEGHPEHEQALSDLNKLFENYAVDGHFLFGTITTAVLGRI